MNHRKCIYLQIQRTGASRTLFFLFLFLSVLLAIHSECSSRSSFLVHAITPPKESGGRRSAFASYFFTYYMQFD
uniref:Putative secreted protein n=1 Tax=Anopheles darlingi TaxID=43151 RepID=A0A2M4D6Q7_ANODA